MPERFDKSLLSSPMPPRSERGGRLVWLVAVVVVVAVIVVWLVLADGDESAGGAADTSTTATSTAKITATTLPALVLEAHSADPALLYYPTLLPEGWEVCRQLEDISRGDRFCDPDDDNVWLQGSGRGFRCGPT